ncbi:MAG: phosphoglycerate kinase [Candidatus Babeliales bacterium]
MKLTNITSHLPSWSLENKKVLVRIDGDVPLKNGSILDDTRLRGALPTLNLIKQKNGKIILLTHIDRPTHQEPELSTRILISWFQKHGFSVTFAPNINTANGIITNAASDIILLENLRFYPEEQKQSQTFAKQLANLGDFYINEAFGTSHRNDTSMVLLPKEFPPNSRTIGLHCAQELTALMRLKDNPERPFILILGGGKVKDKLPYIEYLLRLADNILLCPALVFTFMKAQGKKIGASCVADDVLSTAKNILQSDDARKLIFPSDYLVAQDSFNGPLSIINATDFQKNLVGIAIGPRTTTQFTEIIQTAGTVFFNGPMGFKERKETREASCALLAAMAKSPAYTMIAGGDSVETAMTCDIANTINQLSTGGGACLAFLSDGLLPGLDFILR